MASTLLCVPLLVEDVAMAHDHARLAQATGADLVEYRVDALYDASEASAATIVKLAQDSPLACIVTCRASYEGGHYQGHDDERVALIEALCAADRPPRYVDFEFLAYSRSPEIRARLDAALDANPDVGLILSAHDFDGRPPNLNALIAGMRAVERARVIKVAFRARSLRDNAELADILREKDRPTIALGMGEFGLMSRVLAPKFGAFLTFASLRDTSATAPGQPTLAEMTGLYRFAHITDRTRVYGIIGSPVAHSISPHVHNAGFEAIEHDGVYLPLPIPPEWEHFKATVLALLDASHLDFAGASVTIPHKQHLLRLAREDTSRRWVVDDLTERVGAANTLAVDRDGVCRVTNTDVAGIVAPLRDALGSFEAKRVAVIGAGGVARAAAAGLAQAGVAVEVYARRPEQAEALAGSVGNTAPAGVSVSAHPWETLGECRCDAFVQCTPVGMSAGPDPSACVLPDRTFEVASRETVFFDTVYNPVETPFVRRARDAGARVVTGLEMFVVQASGQFTRWTGAPAPTGLFTRVSQETLASLPGG